jgi:transposase
MSYDKKIREQALKYRATHTLKETMETFGISKDAIYNWEKQYKEKGHLESKPLERSGRKITREALQKDVDEKASDFNHERAVRFNCTAEAIRQALKRYKITRKKNGQV